MTVQELAQHLAEEYRRLLLEKDKKASGNLSSFTYGVDLNGKKYEVYFNLPGYWKVIENGANFNRLPNIGAIERWIEIKPLVPRPNKYGKVPTTKQLAFAISKSIFNRPKPQLPAYNLLDKAIENSQKYIDDYFQTLTEEMFRKMEGRD